MDWTIKPYASANHPPVAALAHSDRLHAKPGERVNLSAQSSSDPDGNGLSYEWFYYPEAGSLVVANGRSGAPVAIDKSNERDASFVVPKNFFRPGSMHIILAVTDDGTPPLTRYRRVIVTTLANPISSP